MAKSPPAWLRELVEELVAVERRALWVGPELPLGDRVDCVCELAEDFGLRGPYAAVFVASAEGELGTVLRAARPVCEPGALLCVLLPEAVAGVGARVARVFDPLGRAGRRPRPLTELCGALLTAGACGVSVRRVDGQLRAVVASLPAQPQVLDRAFDVDWHATG